jgi:hypothetical protein
LWIEPAFAGEVRMYKEARRKPGFFFGGVPGHVRLVQVNA